MTVTLGSAGGASVPNWQLLQTSTPTGVATVTFSGLSGYSKYRVMGTNLTAGVSPVFRITLNGDAGTNYYYTSVSSGAGINANGATSNNYIQLTGGSGGGLSGFLTADVDHALLLTPKQVSANAIQQGYGSQNLVGLYQTTSVLSSISITAANAFTAGSIYLLGAN